MSKITLTDIVNLQNETTAVNAMNTNSAIIELALDNTVSRDGTSPNVMNSDFDMNSHRILNLPAPIYPNDVVRLQDTSTAIGNILTAHSVSNDKLAQAPAFTLKGNNTSATADVTDVHVNQIQAMTNQGLILAGVLLGANMNSTADQAITITMPDHYLIFRVLVTNPSISLTTAVGGIYTGAGKTGVQLIPNSQVYSALTTNALNTTGDCLSLGATSPRLNLSTVYFSLTTPQGAAATADIFIYAIPMYSAFLTQSNPSTLPTRLRLNAPTNFYVATTGSDTTGTGSLSAPWASMGHAYTELQSKYDLSGQSVTVNVADGTYDGLSPIGPIVGQTAPTGLLFKGNVTSPQNVIIAPTTNYCFGAAFDAKYSIAGFKCDMTNGTQDMISTGQGGEIWIVNPNPGSPVNVLIFGTSAGISFNDMSAAFDGRIFIDSWVKYTIDSTGDAISTTGTWTSGAGTVTVPDASAIKPGMVIRGTGLYANSYVVSKVGNVLTLNGAGSFASKVAEPITLTMSRQCHADVGVRGQIIHNTNGTPGYNAITLLGNPHYLVGFLLANGSGAQASFQSIAFTGTSTGIKFEAKTLGSIDTLATLNNPATYLPGDSFTKTATFAADTADITISSNNNTPYSSTEVFAGNLVVASQFRDPSDPTFGTATSEMTLVDMVKGAYGLGTNSDLRLTRKSIAAGTGASLTFVGLVGTGGQYN